MRNCIYWLFLAGAIVFEVAGTVSMALTKESSPLAGMLCMYVLLGFSYFMLAKAVIKLPVGVAFAFWEGFGLALITLSSALFLKEQLDFPRLTGLALVFAGTLLIHHGTTSSESVSSLEENVAGERK